MGNVLVEWVVALQVAAVAVVVLEEVRQVHLSWVVVLLERTALWVGLGVVHQVVAQRALAASGVEVVEEAGIVAVEAVGELEIYSGREVPVEAGGRT